jgi:hypothetical protein
VPIPAAVSIPHTVRRAGAAISPVTSTTNVVNVRAVKQGRNASSKRVSDIGRRGAHGITGNSPQTAGQESPMVALSVVRDHATRRTACANA